MKCINKKYLVLFASILLTSSLLCACSFLGASQPEDLGIAKYESNNYTQLSYRASLYAESLCVTNEDVTHTSFAPSEALTRVGLFDLANSEVLYAKDIHQSLYPASTTKVMTALIALEYGNLDDVVTISSTAASANFHANEQVSGLREGEQVSLRDLLYGLVLYSGNDTAVAIAEHISGDVPSFSELMNQKAKEIFATHTRYVNPHGLHDDDQYTTLYDLYLIFNEAIKNETFMDIIAQSTYSMTLTDGSGNTREIPCDATNYYSSGQVEQPSAATVIGGKTGTTREAGSCVILYALDAQNNPYISIVMNASSRTVLYKDMTNLIHSITTVE